MEKVSIVSVTYRSLSETSRFVESVLTNTPFDHEFIMCANGVQEQDLREYLVRKEREGKIRVLWNRENIGVRAFNQVMRMASTNYVFRCDSDILIQDPYWVKRMVDQHALSNHEIGDVVAVGTANTRGHRIRRTPNTVETDMIMSNCMMIHKPTSMRIVDSLNARLPAMEAEARVRKSRPEGYVGEHADLDAAIEYARLHAPWWDFNFGGTTEKLGYGSDDMWWSIIARWAGLKLVTSSAGVVHFDASMRPGYEGERHRLVGRGFQYMRTVLSLTMDVWDVKDWDSLPNKLPVLRKYKESGELLTV